MGVGPAVGLDPAWQIRYPSSSSSSSTQMLQLCTAPTDENLIRGNWPQTSHPLLMVPISEGQIQPRNRLILRGDGFGGIEDFVCLCQVARNLGTLDGSSAGPGFIDWPLPPLTSGYSTPVVLVLPCVMCLALTGCWRSPLSLTSLYEVMSGRFQQPACDGVIYITAALSLFQHRDTLIRTYEQKYNMSV